MIVGARVEERMKVAGLSQAELARRVGVSQPTIYKLLRRSKKGSTHLHRIARELSTTPAYLTGEIDDPNEGAPPPAPVAELVHVMLPVALPSQDVLARMFEGLLEVVDDSAPLAERARELAELLPSGLQAIRGPLIARASPPARAAAAAALASADPGPRR